ncbi:MAG: hypothetical protein NTW25_10710 [Candidatus Kapabacteria bacterium]|nr:hypothetical protein [Candidatus Kapabacteria bacterium]
MKYSNSKYLTLFFLLIVFNSCSVPKSILTLPFSFEGEFFNNLKYYPLNGKGIVIESNAPIYDFSNGKVGKQIGNFNKSSLNEFDYVAELRFVKDIVYPYYLVVDDGTKIFCLKYFDVKVKNHYILDTLGSTFKINNKFEEEVNNKILSYLENKEDLKIEINNLDLIQTFEPKYERIKGFKILIKRFGNEVEYDVRVLGIGCDQIGCFWYNQIEAEKLVYYIKNGKEIQIRNKN